MPLDASEQNQLIVILTLAVVLFIIASALPQRIGASLLLLLAPYQAIETRFGTSSVVLAYVVFIALILKTRHVQLPLLPYFLFLTLWSMVSMGMMAPSTYVQHGAFIFALISAFLVFWLTFDLTNRLGHPSRTLLIFIVSNVVIACYCAVQMSMGPGERLILFGISEMSLTRVRADGRLMGPFESAEITAQYFVLAQFLLLHQFWYTKPGIWRRGIVLLAAVNLGFLVATGSRGEFLLLIGGAGVYLWLFRQRLGLMRAAALAASGAIALAVTALLVINLTQFGGLFDRLANTEFNEQGIPDTRQKLWPQAWNEIEKSPIIGHGPRLRFHLEDRGVRYEGHVYIQYPHNQYLALLFTIGVPGLILYMLILFRVVFRCSKTMTNGRAPPYHQDLARTGVLIIFLFIIDGAKIEQMRLDFSDYWHFFFGLLGLLIAVCAQAEQSSAQSAEAIVDRPTDLLTQAQIARSAIRRGS